jgi:glycerol-3-phosphate acyltransferase PlsY
MISIYSLIVLLLAYLFGSIPTAVWLGQAFYGVDVREYGSGNAGATNTFRVLGTKAGTAVMFIDILKGWTATNLAYFLGSSITGPYESVLFINYQLILGVIAVLGHLFPVFAGFRGGKGVATLCGMVLAIHLEAALICIGVFVLVLLITKYVSMSSIAAGFAFPFSIVFLFHTSIKSLLLYSICICALVLITHQKNIERLLKGKESKVNLFKRNKT